MNFALVLICKLDNTTTKISTKILTKTFASKGVGSGTRRWDPEVGPMEFMHARLESVGKCGLQASLVESKGGARHIHGAMRSALDETRGWKRRWGQEARPRCEARSVGAKVRQRLGSISGARWWGLEVGAECFPF